MQTIDQSPLATFRATKQLRVEIPGRELKRPLSNVSTPATPALSPLRWADATKRNADKTR